MFLAVINPLEACHFGSPGSWVLLPYPLPNLGLLDTFTSHREVALRGPPTPNQVGLSLAVITSFVSTRYHHDPWEVERVGDTEEGGD